MSEDTPAGRIKKLLYVNRRAPHGTNYGQEGLEVALIGAAFDQDVSMVYMDDGVFQLRKGQDTSDLETKNFTATYRALGDYDVQKVYVEKESLSRRGMGEADLMELMYEDEDDDWEEKPMIRLVDSAELTAIFEDADVIMNF